MVEEVWKLQHRKCVMIQEVSELQQRKKLVFNGMHVSYLGKQTHWNFLCKDKTGVAQVHMNGL